LYQLVEASLFTKDLKAFKKKASKEAIAKLEKLLERLVSAPKYLASHKSGDLQGIFTQSINKDIRLMYAVDEAVKVVKLLGIGTHDYLYSSKRKATTRKQRT
jgi:addiction module RelE/StbE family toxin